MTNSTEASGDPIGESLQPLAEHLLFSGVFEKAEEANKKRLLADLEWTKPKGTHVHILVRAFMHGVISADPWHKNYKLPPDFESVVNWIAFNIQKTYGDAIVVQISLMEMEKKFREWAGRHKSFLKWGEPDDGAPIAVVHACSPVLDKRDFIDLEALIRNASIFLRDKRQQEDAFDRKFKAENPDWSGGEDLPPVGLDSSKIR